MNIDAQKVAQIRESVATKEPNICEITAFSQGEKVLEECWNGYEAGDNLNVMSVTKSIVALLTGIAVDQGFISGIEAKVLDFFPDYVPKRGEKTIYDVTLHHLLSMTAPYKYKSEPWTRVCTSDDWTRAALDILGGRSGITGEFKYSTLGIQIMNGVIERATGMKVIDFANRYLFSPLGIGPRDSHGDSSKEDQFDFLMNKKPRAAEWYVDPKGTATAGWGLTLSATDMAGIGQMLLNGGTYNGVQVISSQWIERMITPNIKLGENYGNMSYGYLWWRPGKDVYAAIGDGGNVIYVNPRLNVVVGVAGTFKPRIFDRVEFIEREIVPRIM